jgi:AhpD family alkylhydroperoxidase
MRHHRLRRHMPKFKIEESSLDRVRVLSVSMPETLKEVETWVERMVKEYPKLAGPFMVWLRRIEEKRALDTKTKELISVALSVATQCKWCIAFHTRNALEAGSTKDEIMEACFVASLFRGGPALMYTQLAMNCIDECKETT